MILEEKLALQKKLANYTSTVWTFSALNYPSRKLNAEKKYTINKLDKVLLTKRLTSPPLQRDTTNYLSICSTVESHTMLSWWQKF